MSKSNVLKRLLPDAKLPRNAFDRSCVVNQTASAGRIMPVFCEAFPQGSHVKLNRQVFTRTADVNTAAFPIIDQHVEFFAVPISYLWSYWDNFKLKVNDYNSTRLPIYSSGGFVGYNPTQVPWFDIDEFLNINFNSGWTNMTTDLMGYSFPNGAIRLMEAFGMPTNAKSPGGSSGVACAQNLFKLAAYQKVYSDHFRNSSYEANDPFSYNLDWLSADGNLSPANKIDFSDSNHKTSFYKLAQMRYVNYRKDYFKNLYPSLNYSSNLDSVTSFSVPSSVIYQLTGARLDSVGINSTGTNQVYFGNNVAGTPSTVFHSVQAVRTAFALDKLLRHISYAPKHIKDQIEARYDVKSNAKQSFESIRIGQFMNDIVIGEVTSMANTESGSTGDKLGALGGKGIGSSSFQNDIEYTCEADCIILGVTYFIPRTSYDSRGADNWNSKLVVEDFFLPEFMDLGLQPLYRKEIYRSATSAVDNSVLGYIPRYQEYKLGKDRNLSAFKNGFGYFATGSGGTIFSTQSGTLQDFVVHSDSRTNFSTLTSANVAYFKVTPSDLSSIMVQTPDNNAIPNDDQFFFNMTIKCISNQNMSVHGQPSF